MSTLTKATFERFDFLMADRAITRKLPLSADTKYAIISDLHLGDGGWADNFAHNEATALTALEMYRRAGYSIILAGDIEELWQFELHEIRERYDATIYAALRRFGPTRVLRIYGNHDRIWGGLADPLVEETEAHRWAAEAAMLGERVLITHGHQGELLSDRSTWISRFFARAFRYVERAARLLGYGDKADTKSIIPNNRERTYHRWADERGAVLICGHTHRALFASRSYSERLKEERERLRAGAQTPEAARRIVYLTDELEQERKKGRDIEMLTAKGDPSPCYYNCGCGCYEGGFTAIEIAGRTIRLAKWLNDETLDPGRRRIAYAEGDLFPAV